MYGVELGYWLCFKLFKVVLINMVVVGVSELVIDVSMDLMLMDLVGKLLVRVG